jgi:hypothetical protein
MSEPRISDEQLKTLRKLADGASPPPWQSMIEGRDHQAGDNFVMIGREDDRDEDLYLSHDSGPASAADHDFIAAARNHIDALLDEIDRLRAELQGRSSAPR